MAKPKNKSKPTYTYPWLNQRVADAVAPSLTSAHFRRGAAGVQIHGYETNVMSRFICHTSTCASKNWGSKKVAIHIVGFSDNGYRAVVFGQRCKLCNEFGRLILDEDSYVERVAYRLKK